MWEDGREKCPNLVRPFEGSNFCQYMDREYVFQTRRSDCDSFSPFPLAEEQISTFRNVTVLETRTVYGAQNTSQGTIYSKFFKVYCTLYKDKHELTYSRNMKSTKAETSYKEVARQKSCNAI
jgi:hypothetical protein